MEKLEKECIIVYCVSNKNFENSKIKVLCHQNSWKKRSETTNRMMSDEEQELTAKTILSGYRLTIAWTRVRVKVCTAYLQSNFAGAVENQLLAMPDNAPNHCKVFENGSSKKKMAVFSFPNANKQWEEFEINSYVKNVIYCLLNRRYSY